MSKLRTLHTCQACGSSQPRWAGRCNTCGEWNTLHEVVIDLSAHGPGGRSGPVAAGGPGLGQSSVPVALAEVDINGGAPMPTGLDELDRVLSGGLLPGSATLLGGEPGTGKSTLLLQALASMSSSGPTSPGRRCLLVAAEEPAQQVRRRAARLGADVPGIFVVASGELDAIEAAVADLAPDVVVVDSVQAVQDPGLGLPAGSLVQVRECASRLTAMARSSGAALVLVGHVTKDGALAGPRTLEHLVDTVLSFEGDRYLSLRALRAVKHRFGPTGETGLFEMSEKGLAGVPDPSALFLGDRLAGSPGSAVAVPVEGYRPVLVEVQALVRKAQIPRRSVAGVDPGRVGLLVAVLDRRAGVPVGDCDVYVSVAGGARAAEPAADLAICLAIASSCFGVPVPADLVAIGEVGLGGELRRAPGMAKRLAEARRLGFATALVPGVEGLGRQGAAAPRGEPADVVTAPSLAVALTFAFGEKPSVLRRGAGAGRPSDRNSLVTLPTP